jgi:protocatechuate 3,4-dioxygenase beta subunit
VASADVRVFQTGTRRVTAELETDAEGRFHAEGLPEAEYRIEVSKPNHIPSTLRTTLSSAPAANLAVRLVRCGSISGRVLDSSGQPVGGAIVFAMRPGAGGLRRDRAEGRFARVDGEGRYRLYGLAPGQYVVAAAYGATLMTLGGIGSATPAPGVGSGVLFYPSNTRPQPFTITSGDTFQNIDLVVLPSNLYSVAGRVEPGTELKSKGRFWLTLASAEQPAIAMAATTAKDDGTFQFDGISPGSYELFVAGPSNARGPLGAEVEDDALFGRMHVDIGSQNIDSLVLHPQKALHVAFAIRASAAGCSSAGQLVLSSVEDWGANLERRSPLSFTEPKIITRLAPARYRVSVTGLGDSCYVPDGTLLDLGAPRDGSPVTITAVPAGAIDGVVSGPKLPSGGAVVLADLSDRSQPVQIALPDSGSRFTFASLRPGRYRVAAKLPSGPSSRWTDESAPGVTVEVVGGETVKVIIPEVPLP